MRQLVAFVRLSRLHFLAGGVLMFALGAFAARPIHLAHYLVGQLAVTSAQLTAHYANEYADFEADREIVNRTAFSGGSGVLVSGELVRGVALKAAYVTTGISVLGILMTNRFSPVAASCMILALIVSWTYSMPPFRLLATGFGELMTAFTVAGLVPAIGALVQGNGFPSELYWLMAILIMVQLAMLLAFELPDITTDAISGKRVLAVRMGRQVTVSLIMWLLIAAITTVAIGYLTHQLGERFILGVLITVPLMLGMFWALRTNEHKRTTLFAVASFFICGSAFLAGVL